MEKQTTQAVFSGYRWIDSQPYNSAFSAGTINLVICAFYCYSRSMRHTRNVHTHESNVGKHAFTDKMVTPEAAQLQGLGPGSVAQQNFLG